MQVDLYSETEIIEGCKQNDRKYQEILYRRFARSMYGICLSYMGNRPEAQDILHEAFLKIFKHIQGFKSEGSLEGWVRRVVTNVAVDHLRKQARISNYLSDYDSTPMIEVPERSFAQLQAKDILKQVARLPEGARTIFNLYAVEGYTHKEIAEELCISEGTSKSQYNRARGLLMNWLGER
jgi:RNA polymerase sigma factor (sigma-70 family)